MCENLGFARGVPIKLESGQPDYFAVIVEYSIWERSILYVYNSSKELVYHEILPEVCASITAISLDDSGTEVLLIGGEGQIWTYEVV